MHDLPKALGDRIRKDELLGGKIFAVSRDMPDSPPMLGRYALAIHISGSYMLRFIPRFPFDPGQSYRAVLDSSAFPGTDPLHLESRFAAPAAPAGKPAGIAAIFPSSDKLPENLLRFYLHFATPMHAARLTNTFICTMTKARSSPTPFLEVSEELWDPSGERLHAAHQSRADRAGLKPRKSSGPRARIRPLILVDR